MRKEVMRSGDEVRGVNGIARYLGVSVSSVVRWLPSLPAKQDDSGVWAAQAKDLLRWSKLNLPRMAGSRKGIVEISLSDIRQEIERLAKAEQDELCDKKIRAMERKQRDPEERGRGDSFPTESDPNGLNPGAAGCKLDNGKIQAALLKDFSLALMAVAEVCTYGAGKYSEGGWQHVVEGVKRYDNAQWRHMLSQKHEDKDKGSGLPHIYHEAWNVLAKLELMLRAEAQK